MPIPQFKNNNDAEKWREARQDYLNGLVNQDPRLTHTEINKPGKKFRLPKSKKKKILVFAASFILLLILSGVGMIVWLSYGLPDPNHLIDREVAQSTKIYDREGKTVLYEISGDEKRTLVSLNDIPNYVKQATIAIEDKDFYKHGGFSIWAIFRTAITDVIYHKHAGASTLTQQFIKNAVLSSEKTVTRKVKELIMAFKVEQKFNKDQILQMYLNEIPYGSTAYGVESASLHYFGKNVKDINLAEAAILAALPQSPSRYSPYGTHKDLLIARQQYILDIMVEQGYIKQEEAEAAKKAPLEFKKESSNIIAPHFVMYIKEMLSDKYGEKMVEQGGLKIITTLDLYKQNIAEEVIKAHADDNEKKYKATNDALVSIDPKTGQILAMVGSRDYFNEEIDGQVNITTSPRQPGSSLKPLVYASAFLKGYTPNTILYDVVTNFSTDPAKPYEPHNYDGNEHGPISMRKALAGSLNIPAVKTIYLAGIDNVLDLAQDLGYSTLYDRERFGLSLVLGGGEVKLLEHANAYSAFAREGYVSPVASILRVEDAKGNVLEEFKQQDRQALDPKIAREINSVLSDNDARSFVFGAKNWLTLSNRPVAAKTGTTNDYRDAWTMGYTPSLVTGVWVGNSDNTEMKRGADGSMVAAPIWHDYMERVLGNTPVEAFRKPDMPPTGKPVLDGNINIENVVKIDKITGKLATDLTPQDMIEEKTFINNPHCILYYIDRNNPLGDGPKNPSIDPQFSLWEGAVQAWAQKVKKSTSTPDNGQPPTETDDVHTQENLPTLEILSPQKDDTITNSFLQVNIQTEAKRGISKVEYYINDNLLAVVESSPFNLEKDISFLNNGFHNLGVKACDDVGNCSLKNIEFNLSLTDNPGDKKVTIEMIEPTNGVALSNIDFPFQIKMNATNYTMINKINLYYQLGNKTPILLGSLQPIESNNIIYNWNKIPASGTYKISAEVITWAKDTVKLPEKIISINNIEKEAVTSTTSSIKK